MNIRLIAETGRSAIVEYQASGATCRAIVPRLVVQDGMVSDDDLAAGIPYGVSWETVVSLEIATELRRCGIWTGKDLAERPQVAAAAIQRVAGQTLAALRRAAAEHEGGTK